MIAQDLSVDELIDEELVSLSHKQRCIRDYLLSQCTDLEATQSTRECFEEKGLSEVVCKHYSDLTSNCEACGSNNTDTYTRIGHKVGTTKQTFIYEYQQTGEIIP